MRQTQLLLRGGERAPSKGHIQGLILTRLTFPSLPTHLWIISRNYWQLLRVEIFSKLPQFKFLQKFIQNSLGLRMKWFLLLIIIVSHGSQGLNPSLSDYENLSHEESKNDTSQNLAAEILASDSLGYNVLTSEVLRKNLGYSYASSVEVRDSSDRPSSDPGLPQAQPLVQDRDFQVNQAPASNWNDEKFWGGPSPFFFPDFGAFVRPRPVSASSVSRPFRHLQQASHPPTQIAPPKTFVGDQHQCSTGSCEFFLSCWLIGGIIEGSCGSFLYACCQRPDGGGKSSQAIVDKVSFFWTHLPNLFFLPLPVLIFKKWFGYSFHFFCDLFYNLLERDIKEILG